MIDLASWLRQFGALAPAEAVILGLRLCDDLARMSRRERRRMVASVDDVHVRRAAGGWRWFPSHVGHGGGDEASAVAAVSRLLRAALMPAASIEPSVPARLDVLLNDGCLGRPSNLHDYAVALIATTDIAAPRASHRTRHVVIATAAVAVGALLWMSSSSPTDAWGLSIPQHHAVRALQEAVVGNAWADEHTTASRQLDESVRILRTTLSSGDARVWWLRLANARVRQLALDWLTAEQLSSGAVAALSRELGPTHPYVNVAHALHVANLQQRASFHLDAATVPELLAPFTAAVPSFRWAPNALGDDSNARADRDNDGNGRSDLIDAMFDRDDRLATFLVDALTISNWEPFLVVGHAAGVSPLLEGFWPVRPDGSVQDAPLTPTVAARARARGWVLYLKSVTDRCSVVVDLGRGDAWRVTAQPGTELVASAMASPSSATVRTIGGPEVMLASAAQETLPEPAIRVAAKPDLVGCAYLRWASR